MPPLSRVIASFFLLGLFFPLFCLAQEKININSAPLQELIKIVHIGEARAQQIISLRPFYSLDELSKIKGIGESRVQDIKDQGLAFIKEKEWTKEQTADKEDIRGEKKDTSYFILSLPLAVISAGSILLLKKNL